MYAHPLISFSKTDRFENPHQGELGASVCTNVKFPSLYGGTLSRPIDDSPWACGCHCSVFINDLAIDDDVSKTFGVLVWLVIGSLVAHAVWVKHGDIGFHSRAQRSAITETDACSWERTHFAHGILQRDDALFPDVHGENTSECAVASRMRRGLAEYRDFAIGSNHRSGMYKNALQIFLAHCMENASATTVFDQPEDCLGGVVNSRVTSLRFRHLTKIFSCKGGVPVACHNNDILGITATTLGQQNLGCSRLDPGARCWLL